MRTKAEEARLTDEERRSLADSSNANWLKAILNGTYDYGLDDLVDDVADAATAKAYARGKDDARKEFITEMEAGKHFCFGVFNLAVGDWIALKVRWFGKENLKAWELTELANREQELKRQQSLLSELSSEEKQ